MQNKASTSPSSISVDLFTENPTGSDVFLATSPTGEIIPSGHFPTPYGSYFHQTSYPQAPTAAPDHFYETYSLPAPPPPRDFSTRRATVEEVVDDNDLPCQCRHPNTSSESLDSLDSETPDPRDPRETDTAAFDKAAGGDPLTQDVYAETHDVYSRLYDAFSGPGRLREAPTIENAVAAIKDLSALLRGEKRGDHSKGYKDPQFDPFVRKRMEGMRTLLNLYTDKRSKTFGHWGASAMQTAIGLGRGCYFLRIMIHLQTGASIYARPQSPPFWKLERVTPG